VETQLQSIISDRCWPLIDGDSPPHFIGAAPAENKNSFRFIARAIVPATEPTSGLTL
jgi:hypothetical protein